MAIQAVSLSHAGQQVAHLCYMMIQVAVTTDKGPQTSEGAS
jgi:hypothetical protein